MSFTSTLTSAARLTAVTPSLWIYGLASAALGAAIMTSALLAAFPKYDQPVGHGMLGWLILAAVLGVSLAIEAAASRAAAGKTSLAGAVADSGRFLPRGAGLVPALMLVAVVFAMVVAVPVFAFLRSLLAAILIEIFPLAVHMTVILGSAIAGLALLVPAWMMLPLAVRCIGIHNRGVLEGIGDAMTVIGERPGLTFLCGLFCAGLDLALLYAGSRLLARDLSLTGHFHVLLAWNGTHTAAGAVLLGLAALAAAFKAGIWTVIYVDVAKAQNWSEEPRPVQARGALMRLGILSRCAARDMRRSAVPFILAALIVLIGMPATADLLSVYHLVPLAADDSASRIADQFPGGRRMLLMLFFPAMLVSGVFSTALVAATEPLSRNRPAGFGTALGIGLRSLFRVIGASVVMIVTVGLIGAVVLVAVLFAMALVVEYAKGLNDVAEQFGHLVALVVVAAGVILSPFVVRAVVLEKQSPGKALERGLSVATSQSRLVFLAFLVTASMEVLRGPIARWAGLITSGWAELYAADGRVHPPIPHARLATSAVSLVIATLFITFQAQLWTEIFNFAAVTAKKNEPAKPEINRRRKSTSGQGNQDDDEP